jgi:SNF2 family DNA or RNA helicase
MINEFEHQTRSIEFIRTRPRVFDASDPGTGKTYVAIKSFNARRMRGGGALLVVAPKTILRTAWKNDFYKFAPHLEVSVATAEVREEAFKKEADVYAINHDGVNWLAARVAKDKDFLKRFDSIVIDESGAYKHHTSQRSKSIKKLVRHFEYREAMNGTPNPNSILELWHQMVLLDDGKRLGDSFYAFRNHACTPKQVGPSANMVKWVDRPGVHEAVAKLIEDITIRHKFEECIDIPPNHRFVIEYHLTDTQMKVYRQMKAASLALIKDTVITAVNAASVATKLLQIASGAVYDESGKWHLIDRERYELVMDLVEQRKQCVVFFLWQHQKECLIEEARKRGITFGVLDGSITSDAKREETVNYFQNGLYRIILAHPQSAAHGLTLTKGTSTIWASPTYNLEHFIQGNKRIYRAGQTERTETVVIVAQGTIEAKVMAALENKSVGMEVMLSLLEDVETMVSLLGEDE